jgi:hypothetical protein
LDIKVKVIIKKNEITTRDAYFAKYKSKQEDDKDKAHNLDEVDKKRNALNMALDTRKFEIELYWKRATYFATFIGLMFTSYYVVAAAEKIVPVEAKYEMLLLISAIGVFSSLCWFLVNKGSKYWQENWEIHVDLLEDDVMGPLYKTTKYCNDSWKKGKWGIKFWENINWNSFLKINRISPFKSYKYSVGKIGIYLSFMIVVAWLSLFVKQVCNIKGWDSFSENNVWIITGILIISIVFLLLECESTGNNGQDKDDSSFDKREIQ